MPTNVDPNTVVVSDSAGVAATMATIRSLLVAVGAFAIGKGWISSDQVENIIAAIVVAGPAVYGIYKTFTRKKETVQIITGEKQGVLKSQIK